MPTTRRHLMQISGVGSGLLAAGLARPSLAMSNQVRIGWLPALTGASSSTGIAMTRGITFGVAEINAAGGVGGRQLELITRDTQSDPTKAVNAATELTRGEKVHVVWGPGNSGEGLACTPVIARARTPHLHPCWVDTMVDPEKYPMSFRGGPSNQQVGAAANRYVINITKARDVAVVGDTTGYGTSSVETYVPMLKAAGANVDAGGEVGGRFTPGILTARVSTGE